MMAHLEQWLTEHREALEGDYIVAIEAEKFVTWVQANHPEDFAEWMRVHAVQFVAQTMNRQVRRHRTAVRKSATVRAFSDAGSNPGKLAVFKMVFVVDDHDTRRPLSNMTGADCAFAGGRYDREGNRALAMGAFLSALGKQAGRRTVGEVMTEANCHRLLRSFLGSEEPELRLAA